jgi:hypothetical protein
MDTSEIPERHHTLLSALVGLHKITDFDRINQVSQVCDRPGQLAYVVWVEESDEEV